MGVRRASRSIRWIACAGLLWLGSGCAQWYEIAATRDGDAIRDEKAAQVEAFRSTDLLDPRLQVEVDDAGPPDIPEVITLGDALRIATERNRDYIARKESFFLAALDLSLTRRDFLRPVFSGNVNYTASNGQRITFGDSGTLSLAASQFLRTGATVTASTAATLSRSGGAGGRDQTSTSGASVRIDQPILRGAWHDIAFEGLTQAERNVLYEARDFELFRQDFAIGIIRDYYDLVSQKQQIQNLENNIAAQQRAVDQADAFFRVGRGTLVDKFRAEQSFFRTQNDFLDSQQAYQVSLDRFKIRLGLPTATTLDVGEDLPEDVQEIRLRPAAAVAAAFQNRLDLLTFRDQVVDVERQLKVSKNSLLPDLNVFASYDVDSRSSRTFAHQTYKDDLYTVGVNLEIPFDRMRERNSYRRAQIALDQIRRDLEEFEDNLILDVRESLRNLKQLKSQIDIEAKNIESLDKRVRQAKIENRQGNATNRDIVEAEDEKTRAENQQLDRFVSYEIRRLTLLRQMGILFVDEEGLILP